MWLLLFGKYVRVLCDYLLDAILHIVLVWFGYAFQLRQHFDEEVKIGGEVNVLLRH